MNILEVNLNRFLTDINLEISGSCYMVYSNGHDFITVKHDAKIGINEQAAPRVIDTVDLINQLERLIGRRIKTWDRDL